jgi:hypothetical protein
MTSLYASLRRHDPGHDLHADDEAWHTSHCHVEFHEFDARELFGKYCGEDGVMGQDGALQLMHDMYPGYEGSLEFVCEELFNEQMLSGEIRDGDGLKFENFVDFHNDMVEMLGKTGGWTEDGGDGDAWTSGGRDLDSMQNLRPSTQCRVSEGAPIVTASCGCLGESGRAEFKKSSLEILNDDWGF